MSSPLDPKDLLDIPDPFAASKRTGDPLAPPDVSAWPSSPTRPRTRGVRVVAVVAAVAFELLLVWKMGLRSGGGFGPSLVGVAVLLPTVAVVLLLSAVRTSASRRGHVLGVVALAALVFVVTTLLTGGEGESSLVGMGRCVVGTSMMAAGPAVLAILAMRHAFVTGASLRTAALGVGAGVLAAAATRLYCPNDGLGHVLVSHGLPIALAAAFAVALGTRVTRA